VELSEVVVTEVEVITKGGIAGAEGVLGEGEVVVRGLEARLQKYNVLGSEDKSFVAVR
jgi:hypothetical protein